MSGVVSRGAVGDDLDPTEPDVGEVDRWLDARARYDRIVHERERLARQALTPPAE